MFIVLYQFAGLCSLTRQAELWLNELSAISHHLFHLLSSYSRIYDWIIKLCGCMEHKFYLSHRVKCKTR